MKFISFLSYNIFNDNLSHILNGNNLKYIINTINPHSFVIAEKDILFKEALLKSDILLPDGIGIVKAIRYLLHENINRITGHDVFLSLLNDGNKGNKKIFFLGSTNETLIKIKNKIKIEYPNIVVEYYSPPFKNEFSLEENDKIVKGINDFNPNILFVGMTAPKQEKWSYINKEKINAKVIVNIGAVFNFYAGDVKRSSKFFINLGMEWLPRLIREPKRLWKRTFISAPLFLFYILKYKFQNK